MPISHNKDANTSSPTSTLRTTTTFSNIETLTPKSLISSTSAANRDVSQNFLTESPFEQNTNATLIPHPTDNGIVNFNSSSNIELSTAANRNVPSNVSTTKNVDTTPSSELGTKSLVTHLFSSSSSKAPNANASLTARQKDLTTPPFNPDVNTSNVVVTTSGPITSANPKFTPSTTLPAAGKASSPANTSGNAVSSNTTEPFGSDYTTSPKYHSNVVTVATIVSGGNQSNGTTPELPVQPLTSASVVNKQNSDVPPTTFSLVQTNGASVDVTTIASEYNITSSMNATATTSTSKANRLSGSNLFIDIRSRYILFFILSVAYYL